jgi:mannose-1-phosphate guanylyltransferase
VIYSVIMAGGKGERFWPLSRSDCPKQLLRITSDKTMLEETIERMEGFIPLDQVRIVTGNDIKENIAELIPDIKVEHIYTEPFGRNTCLAIGLSAAMLHKEDPDGLMVVLSSDHLIKPKDALLDILRVATGICNDHDWLITLGITPTRPEIGYGYIELGDHFDTIDGVSVYKVAEFNEKPTRVVAQQYYYDRKHLWNSGMFIWSVKSILKAINKHKPELGEALKKYTDSIGTPEEEEIKKELYINAENVSIDVAILEQANNVLSLKADLTWDDVGSWLALDRIRERDSESNILVGNVVNLGAFESIIYNDSDGMIATLGVSDLIIVKTDNIVMVAHKTRVNEIKSLLSKFGGDEELEKYL